MPRIVLTVLTTFRLLFMLIICILSISLHTFPALVYMEFLDGAGILLPKQSLLMLLGPIGVCVRATLSPTLAQAAFRPRFPLSHSSYKLKPGDLYLHLSHTTFSGQHSPRCCSVVKSKLRFPGHFGGKSLCSLKTLLKISISLPV